MAATGQEMAYRCEQCGSSEIVALSQLYEQGTRSFSGRFTSGVSQSFTAKAASPPSPRIMYEHYLVGDSQCSFVSFGVSQAFVGYCSIRKRLYPLKAQYHSCFA